VAEHDGGVLGFAEGRAPLGRVGEGGGCEGGGGEVDGLGEGEGVAVAGGCG